jgi:Signal transduction histidine kinase
MKIRKILIAITVLLGLVYGVTVYYVVNTQIRQVDIGVVNDVVKTLEEEIQAKYTDGSGSVDIKRSGVKNMMNYRITLIDDSDYQEQIYQAVKEQKTVMDLYAKDRMIGKVLLDLSKSEKERVRNTLLLILTFAIGATWIIICIVVILLYQHIVNPFRNMQNFARRVAQGDLDFQLHINRDNYFGAFTESFDLMREELKRARQGEYEANKSKKELVAELSHDIMTPIATIKAICELMEARWGKQKSIPLVDAQMGQDMSGLIDFSKEKMHIVYQKADMVDRLISNLFHATLEELEMLKVEPMEEESKIIEAMFREINHYEKIRLLNEIPDCLILCDRLRLGQAIDNIITNSYKYADTPIDVQFKIDQKEKLLKIKIKDYGQGVEESELPLICQKFYRGSDEKVKNATGSGLGLYLAKLFMEQMKGTFDCYNETGFAVEIGIRIV